MPLQFCTQHRGNRLDLLSQPQCRAVEHLFADPFTDQVDLQHRKIICCHFFDERFFSGIRHFGLRRIHRFAHITECFVEVLRDIKFNEEAGHTL